MTQIPGAQLSPRERGRCSEVIWAQFGGYERCHRNKGHEPLPHHVRDAFLPITSRISTRRIAASRPGVIGIQPGTDTQNRSPWIPGLGFSASHP